jgi:hypothetical protein
MPIECQSTDPSTGPACRSILWYYDSLIIALKRREINCGYLNLRHREEGGQFFRIVPDPKRRRALLAPEKESNPNPHLVAV